MTKGIWQTDKHTVFPETMSPGDTTAVSVVNSDTANE